MASSSTASSVQQSFAYDIFLSFRGEDTRKNFVDHLYTTLEHQGIYTYKDDEKMEKGKQIKDDLFKSIESSRLFIIVFSKNYASSSWCLDELVKIMDCHNTNGCKAYPVFYDVEPTEVRKQSGAFGDAFAKLKDKVAAGKRMKGNKKTKWMLGNGSLLLVLRSNSCQRDCTCIPFSEGNSAYDHKDEVDIGKWREALVDAANLSGWDLKNTSDGHEAKVIQKVVEEVSLELRSINYSAGENLVGMESRFKDIESILEIDSTEVSMIGIKGMGGGGKTTLARAVYHKLGIRFEGRSFVENVREVSNNPSSGLKSLQKQVLFDVLSNQAITITSVTNGNNMMKMRLGGQKVLIVLDDVDHLDQLEALAGEPSWFKPGSVIIITTRDEQLLIAHQVKWILNVNLLSDEEAISLFNMYAFKKMIPDKGYKDLSRQVVRYAAGLPLSIKVLGSFLCGKIELEWKDALERLKKIPLKETLEKLELSYISLEDDYKEIFLDVACFLKGFRKDKASRILESCGFHAINGLRVLEQKSLITITHDLVGQECLGMHDHLQEMGRNIVRRNHVDEPNKHSRLWIHEEIENVLANNLDNEVTRCIVDLERLSPETLMKGFGSMKKLRILVMSCYGEVRCDWEFDEVSQYFPNALRHLECNGYPFLSLPKTFLANNLVALELNLSNMEQLWDGRARKVFNNLHYLQIAFSNLKTLDLRMTPNLRQLILFRCGELVELHMPFKFPELTSICIEFSKLKTLDLNLTPKLQKLTLEECLDFIELQMPINGCSQLACLKVIGTKLKSLDLKLTLKLQQLELQRCNEFVDLHMPIGSPELISMDLSHLKLKNLDLGLTPKLRKLSLTSCHDLVHISAPDGFLKELTYLNLGGCSLFTYFLIEKDLKYHEFKLTAKSEPGLGMFQLSCVFKEQLLSSNGNLQKLISLALCHGTNFNNFSESICGLPLLRELKLAQVPQAPKDLRQLACLEKLYLSSNQIKHLPDSICLLKHLKSLQLDHAIHLEKLPENIGQLECLELLHLEYTGIKNLPDSICMLKHLKYLELIGCKSLENLPDGIGGLECLELLHLEYTGIKNLPDSICMLKHLKYLELIRCKSLEKLPDGIGGLECLEILLVVSAHIKHLPESICLLKHLISLQVKDCWILEKLPEDLGQLERLKILILKGCKQLPDVPNSICKIKCLTWFYLRDCISVEKLPEEIGHLKSLKVLDIVGTRISHIPHSIFVLKGLRIMAYTRLIKKSGYTFSDVQRITEDVTSCYIFKKEPNDDTYFDRYYYYSYLKYKEIPC